MVKPVVKLRKIQTPGQKFHGKSTKNSPKNAFQTNFLNYIKQAKFFKNFVKLRGIRSPGQNFHAKKTQFFFKKAFQLTFRPF
jgi:hypothetical protein